MTRVRTFLLPSLILAWAILLWPCMAAAEPVEVTQARELLDTYFGQPRNLVKARYLLQSALKADSANSAAYVEAARLVIKGGYLFQEHSRQDRTGIYDVLLTRALVIDPRNAKAHILKAEAHDMQGNYAEERASLARAESLGTKDPWLWVGYGRYHGKVGNITEAYAAYAKVEALGPGVSLSERNAYVFALSEVSTFRVGNEDMDVRLRRYAALVLRERHPQNAWIVGDFAYRFLHRGLFEDAIQYAREALKTMNYGSARLALAESLYAQAALLIEQKKNAQALPLIRDAEALGIDPDIVLEALETAGPAVDRLMPILQTIVVRPRSKPVPRTTSV
jgi:tetratricopeptide (TPR) repeat protein